MVSSAWIRILNYLTVCSVGIDVYFPWFSPKNSSCRTQLLFFCLRHMFDSVFIDLTRFGRSSACKYFFAFLFTDVSGSQDGSIRMWEFGHAQEITSHHTSGSYQRVTRARFSPQGNKAS